MYDQEKLRVRVQSGDEGIGKYALCGYSQEAESEEERDTSVWNWYIEALYDDVTADLMEKYDCDQTKAEQMLYHSGLKIYCAMDRKRRKSRRGISERG